MVPGVAVLMVSARKTPREAATSGGTDRERTSDMTNHTYTTRDDAIYWEIASLRVMVTMRSTSSMRSECPVRRIVTISVRTSVASLT